MIKHAGLKLAIIMLLACSGCFWGWNHDRGWHGRGGYHDQDRGDHGNHR